MKDYVSELLRKSVKELYNIDIIPQVQYPKEESYGDFSTNVSFILSKTLKQNPNEIANTIVNHVSNYEEFKKVEALKGFINIRISDKFYERKLFQFLKDPENYLKEEVYEAFNIKKEDVINLEYVSANPTGPLHLGHGRGAVIGDVLYRLFLFFGIKAHREYYINDAGNQVNLLAQSILHFIDESYPFPEEGYKGDYIKDIANALKDKVDKNLSFEEKIELLKDLSVNLIMEDIKNTLKSLNIEFDTYFSEKSLHPTAIEEAINLLKERGYVEEYDGALWFKADKEDKDRVLRKKDGSYTYFASDIAYHLNKYRRGFKKAINLWGADHHGYIPRLKSALKVLGIEDNWLEIELFQIVKLFEDGQEIRMSKRTGKMLKLSDVIEEIGVDNLRFIFLTKNANTPLNIDINLVKSQNSENPVFYVQYAYARTNGIKRQLYNMAFSFYEDNYSYEEEEIELIKSILNTKDILKDALIRKDPSLVVKASLDIAKSFHKFYNKYRIITDDEISTKKRITLVYATQKVFDVLFDILNIKAPEIM